MAIGFGISRESLRAQRALDSASYDISKTQERLSSGLRINSASDDAAGLAISSTLNTDQRIFSTGIRNLNDGLSATNIAQGALESISTIVNRQKELAEQAANGVYSIAQRSALNTEANQLVKEFNRIVQTTSFNGQKILDGSFSFRHSVASRGRY